MRIYTIRDNFELGVSKIVYIPQGVRGYKGGKGLKGKAGILVSNNTSDKQL